MKSYPDYQHKSKEELTEELRDLHQKYDSLRESYENCLSVSKIQDSALSKLKQYTIELSNLSPEEGLEVYISRMIREFTGARGAVFSDYNSGNRTLTVQHIELEPGLLEKVISLIGKQIRKIHAYVDEEMYREMTTDIIGTRETLYEASFGAISRPVGAAIQKLVRADRFIGIAFMIEGKLYGTSLLGMGKDQPDPPREILENLVYLAAVSLRRKKAEDANKESQTQISALLQAIPDLMFLHNKEGVYMAYHAPEGSELYAAPDIFIGKHISDVLPAEVAEGFNKVFENALRTRQVQNFEYLLPLKSGTAYFESRTIAYDDEKLLSFIRDITERKVAELKIQEQNQELKKLNEDKDRFMSILAHDLKNPFNSILGFLEILSQNLQTFDMEKIQKLVTLVKTSSEQYYRLLESLLLWARAQSGKMPYEPQRINGCAICHQVAAELKLSAQSKNITVQLPESNDYVVFADMEMLKTILRNLISNAIKFSNPGGTIQLYAESEGDMVIIVVSDNGIGISPEKIATLFDISASQSTKGTAGEHGTGLGLFLCKELVEKQGGRIWVESELGKGCDFKFTLPRYEKFK